jgi:hypothetical protein
MSNADLDTPIENLIAQIKQAGFCFADSERMRILLQSNDSRSLSGWEEFAASWNDMPQDKYMADGGRYRRRRHATLNAFAQGPITLKPHQPHYQSTEYNSLNGGIAREYAPIDREIVIGNTMTSVLEFCRAIFNRMLPEKILESASWHIELHQFRIEASNGMTGKPTPEGVHRDGVDFVLVMMVRRVNISSGTTTMHDLQQRSLDSFTLTNPLDSAIVDDSRCMHGVTAVEQIDSGQLAYRDVLVVTFKNIAAGLSG